MRNSDIVLGATKQSAKGMVAIFVLALLIIGIVVAIPLLIMAGTVPDAGAVPGKADFNGDGFADLAMGVPFENVGTVGDAGSVNVIYGSSAGLSALALGDGTGKADQLWHQNSGGIEESSEAGDNFGLSVATGDFNNDGFSDLAVGVPFEDIGSATDAGAVNLIYGSSSGLLAAPAGDGTGRLDQIWHENVADVSGTSENSDLFGYSLAAGDFNNDGFDDLAVGVPLEDIGILPVISDAGIVQVIYGSSAGLSVAVKPNQIWNQNTLNVEDVAENGDAYGIVLAAGDFKNNGFDDLAIGVPFENIGSVTDAGAVNVIYGTSSGLSTTTAGDEFWNQNSLDIDDTAESGDTYGGALAAGDFNNDGRSDLAIGISEDVGSLNAAGAVNVIYGASAGLSPSIKADQLWHQDIFAVEGSAEAFDAFGSSLAAGDFDNDGRDDLAIGVTGENIGAIQDAGAANVIYGSSLGLSASAKADQLWYQDVANVEDASEGFDHFGKSLAAGDFNNDGRSDLAVGVNTEDVGAVGNAGATNVIHGSSLGLSATAVPDQFWHQGVSNVEEIQEAGDQLGSSIASN